MPKSKYTLSENAYITKYKINKVRLQANKHSTEWAYELNKHFFACAYGKKNIPWNKHVG